ncbi:MAG: GreA/GreB family elongation factor [Allosphingosinicella sp.]
MSVAFRRESDEEHKEPRFEIPLPPGPNVVTARGLEAIRGRVEALEAEVAAEPAEDRLEQAKRELRYWRTRLATATVAPVPPGDEVAFGARVTYRHGGEERTIDIVGHDEADPAAGKLAFSAPLARAMIGAGAGDFVDFAGEADAIEIVAVSASPAD